MKLNTHSAFKWLFIFSLVWILTDGIPRKWFLHELAGPLFFVKYILFGLSYLFLFVSELKIPRIKYSYQLFLSVFIGCCIVGLFTNKLGNPLVVGVIGLVIHLAFVPLVHTSQYLFKSIDAILKLARVIAYVSIPIGILGGIQYYLPVDHPLNGFANDEQLISRAAGFTRISSIFSFLKIYNAYLLFCIIFLLGVSLIKLLRNESVWLYAISILILIANMFMTASRLPIILMSIYISIFVGYVYFNFSNLRKTVTVFFVTGILITIGLYTTTDVFKNPIDSTIDRFEQAESRHRTESTGYTDLQLRLQDRVDIFKFGDYAGFFGIGIGMAYQGAQGVIKFPIPFYFEEEGERLVLELGVFGGIIVVLMRLAFFIYTIKLILWCKNIELKILLTSFSLLLLAPILTLQMTTFSYMENFFYYFSFGIVIAIYKIQQNLLITNSA